MSNYPPGVTGCEPEIIGSDASPWQCCDPCESTLAVILDGAPFRHPCIYHRGHTGAHLSLVDGVSWPNPNEPKP